jgi:hypothetical protein
MAPAGGRLIEQSAADLDEASVETATGGITLYGSIGVAAPPR